MFDGLERWLKRRVAGVLLRAARERLPEWPERARDAALRSFLLFRLTGDLPAIAASADALAEALYLAGDYRNSRRYAAAAYRLYRRNGKDRALCLILALLAGTSLRLGRLQASLKHAEKSYALAQKLGEIDLLAIALGNWGQTLTQLGRFEEARESVIQSIRLMEEHNMTRSRNYLVAINTLGILYTLLNQDGLAKPLFGLVRELANEADDASLLSMVNANLGILCWRYRDWEGSVPYFQQSMEIARRRHDVRTEGEVSLNLARAFIELGRPAEAIPLLAWAFGLARRSGNHELEGLVHVTESRLYEMQQRHDAALASAERAFAIFTTFGSDEHRRNALHGLARTCILVRDLERAAELLEEAVQLEEAVSRNLHTDALLTSMFDTQASAFEDLSWVQVELGRHEDALVSAERGRARVLAREIAERAEETEAPPDFDEIRAIAASLNSTFLVLSLIRHPVHHFDRDPDGYVVIWAVPPDRSKRVAFHRSSSLRGVLPNTERSLSLGERIQFAQTGVSREDQRLMHDWFIAPVEHALPADQAALVTVVPMGPLAVMPLAMACGADGIPFVEKHPISIVPSIQTLRLALSRERRGVGALVVGDPETDGAARLPFARAEAELVAKRMEVNALIGVAATHDAVVQAMPGKRLLHFATHAVFDHEDAASDHGALLLTGARLTAREIRAMSLDADLVVLSACNSGQGRIAADGVLGLSRSFLLAGAGSVLATLWEIPDDATLLLMDAFYERRAEHGNLALALREAMLHLRSIPQFAEPVNWAAFVLIGLPTLVACGAASLAAPHGEPSQTATTCVGAAR